MAYWTPERMAAAKPRDLRLSGSPVIPAVKPEGSPGKGPGGGGGGGGGGSEPPDSSGSSWNWGGDIQQRTGKVYFSLSGGNWQCSGSVVADQTTDRALVLTAGHCAVDERNGTFATNWVFIPDWDAKPASFSTACAPNATRYGCWTASALVVHAGFATAGSFNEQATRHDWAFAVVGPGGYSGQYLDVQLGALGIQFSGVSSGNTLASFGYPAAGKYKGNDLVYCKGPIFTDQYNSDATWGMTCNMTGGSSGGPWVSGLNASGANGVVRSLNSYKYQSLNQYMFGPMFNSATCATYNTAKTTSSNQVVTGTSTSC